MLVEIDRDFLDAVGICWNINRNGWQRMHLFVRGEIEIIHPLCGMNAGIPVIALTLSGGGEKIASIVFFEKRIIAINVIIYPDGENRFTGSIFKNSNRTIGRFGTFYAAFRLQPGKIFRGRHSLGGWDIFILGRQAGASCQQNACERTNSCNTGTVNC